MRRRQRYIKESNTSSRPLLIIFLAVLVPILALVNIIMSAQVSDLGFKIAEYTNSKNTLAKQNQDLEQQIYEHSALTHIHKKADQMGFTTEKEYISIPDPLPVAYNR